VVHIRSVKVKSFPSLVGPSSSADLHLHSLHPVTNLYCDSTITGLMDCAVCLFTAHHLLVVISFTHGRMAKLS